MRIIGLMSGTSVDGIDAALVEIEGDRTSLTIHLLQAKTYPYSESLRSQILDVCSGTPLSMDGLATLDDAIAQEFAKAALAINHGHPKAQLIGSHGQTVFHRPRNPQATETLGYSLQLGRGDLIAHLTQIETISNFRAADIAAQGQGAPLVPPIDAALLTHPSRSRAIQNIGGIGNVTYLPARNAIQTPILGWDTGPGNVLLDLAVTQFTDGERTYDADGAWAASGQICHELVTHWLTQPFFSQAPPKSTGREQFGAAYLARCRQEAKPFSLTYADILATLTELTARSIAQSYQQFLPALPDEVLLCGGGSQNSYLKSRIQAHLPSARVLTTNEAGINADAKEAIAFAVLAYWRHDGQFGNLPTVTGATQFVLLGEIYPIAVQSACVSIGADSVELVDRTK